MTWSKKVNHKKKHVTCKNANHKKHQVTQLPGSWRSPRQWEGCCSSPSQTTRSAALTTLLPLSKTCAVKNGTHHQNPNIKTINNQTKSWTKEYKVPWRTRARCCWGHFQTDFRLIIFSLCGTNFATMSGPEIWSITGNLVTMLSLQYHLGHICSYFVTHTSVVLLWRSLEIIFEEKIAKNLQKEDAKDCTKIINHQTGPQMAQKCPEILPIRVWCDPHKAFMEVSGCSLITVMLDQKPIKIWALREGLRFLVFFFLKIVSRDFMEPYTKD